MKAGRDGQGSLSKIHYNSSTNSIVEFRHKHMFLFVISRFATGLVRTVVSISHCGCDDPGSIPGLDIYLKLHSTITVTFVPP